MSDSNPKPGKGASRSKPRVKSFLRQASAIIASEKGMNAGAQQKLKNLAEYLKMPEEEFHEALAQLQQTKTLPTGLNRYEKDFMAFLKQEFKQLEGGILTVTMETKAIDLAARKYDIQEPRARKLIHDQAESMGVGRIAHGDAESYVEQLIGSRIGDATQIEETARKRFYKIGQKWGVGQKKVDEIILQTIGANRKLEVEEQGNTGRAWVTITLFLLLIGSGAVLTFFAKDWSADQRAPRPKATVPPVVEKVDNAPWVMPGWWHAHNLDVIADRFRDSPENEAWLRKIASENLQEQREGIDSLLNRCLAKSGSELRELHLFLASYYYASPVDTNASQIVDWLTSRLDLVASRVPANPEKLKSIYAANQVLGHLSFFQSSEQTPDWEQRKSRLNSVVQQEFGGGPWGDDQISYLQATHRVIAINQWNHLLKTSWVSPNRTALVVPELYDLTQSRLKSEELGRLHRRTVMSILESEPSLWTDLQGEVQKAIELSPDTVINTWINHFENAKDDGYQDWLGGELVKRCKLEGVAPRREEIAEALQKVKTGNRREQFRDLLLRNEKADQITTELENRRLAESVSPQLIAEVARAVNLSMLLAPDDQSSFRLDEFDYLYRRGVPNLATMARKSLQGKNTGKAGTATRSDFLQVEKSLEKLKSKDSNQREGRLSALRRLAEVSVRLEDLDYHQAEVLAKYYLRLTSARERVQAEKELPTLARLPSFGLAVSELMSERFENRDIGLTLLQYFTESDYELEDPLRWQQETREAIFESVLERAVGQKVELTDRKLRWQFLREEYMELCRQRVKLLGLPLNEKAGPLDLAREIVFSTHSKSRSQIDYPALRTVEVIREQAVGELAELVALNRLQVKLLGEQISARWPRKAIRVGEIIDSIDQGIEESVAHRMLAVEFALLQLWELERKAISDRLINR